MPGVSRLDDLRGVELAINRIARISNGRVAARHRSERSGVMLSRPAITILATLRGSGPVRLSLLARLTDLEAPLISREIRELAEGGYVRRTADPTDGRAGIVDLTAKGRRAYQAYRDATDEIIAETFEALVGRRPPRAAHAARPGVGGLRPAAPSGALRNTRAS